MIVNMHIPKTYNTWIPKRHNSKRVNMCGSRSTAKYSGIPGITYQPAVIDTQYGPKPGWCLKCSILTMIDCLQVLTQEQPYGKLLEIYQDAIDELEDAIAAGEALNK
jgi:hypothetical protein